MKRFKYLPDIWGAVVILAVLYMLEILIWAGFYDAGTRYEYGDPRSAVISVIANGIIFSLLMYLSGMKYRDLFHPSSTKVSSTIFIAFLPVVLFCIGTYGWLSDLLYFVETFFPVHEQDSEVIMKMMSSGFITLITICIIAPLLEEMLFRGIILRGFLGRYSSSKAIILSSLLFAIMHFNYYQTPSAFIIGCFLGWLFYTTRSLWPGIIGHATMNALAYISFANSYQYSYSSPVIIVLSFMLSFISLYVLLRTFRFSQASS